MEWKGERRSDGFIVKFVHLVALTGRELKTRLKKVDGAFTDLT
jgi:hypothetical protein